MNTAVAEPPVRMDTGLFDNSFDNNNNIQFYLAYKYLPVKNISTLIKTIDEIYELIYLILYGEKVPETDRLTLDYAATGNSFEWLVKLLEAIKPSRKALRALTITAAIISTPIAIESQRKSVAERHQIEASIQKANAETRKINAEAESIELENILRRNKISQDSIAIINTEKNRMKIARKKSSIKKAVTDKPITQFVINNTIIFKRSNE